MIRPWQSEDCTCPRWQPTDADSDGAPCDYESPDDSCDCELHCTSDDDEILVPTVNALTGQPERPMTPMAEMLSEMRRMSGLIDAEECWCTGTAPTLGCPTHWPAPGGVA